MSKEPSKLDQRRALGERRAAELEAKRAPLAERLTPKPNWSWQQDEPAPSTAKKIEAVSAKGLKQAPARPAKTAADLQAEADKVAAKGRADGKKSVWISGKQAKLLKMAAAKHEVTQEAIVAEGVSAMLSGKYKP